MFRAVKTIILKRETKEYRAEKDQNTPTHAAQTKSSLHSQSLTIEFRIRTWVSTKPHESAMTTPYNKLV